MARWFYTGDVNIENGGYFYRLDGFENGYSDVVRVTPCSDGGGPSHMWWIEALTVNGIDDVTRIKDGLNCIGADLDDYTKAQQRHVIVDALLAYGYSDPANCWPQSSSETVEIGKQCQFDSPSELVVPTVKLRGGSSLERYVRREFLNGRV